MTPKYIVLSAPVKTGTQSRPLTEMAALSSYVAAVLLAATCIAIVTAAAVQLLRPLLSAGNQLRCIYDWALERMNRSLAKAQLDADQESWLMQQANQDPILIAGRSQALSILRYTTNKPIRTLNMLLIKQGSDLLINQFGIKTKPAMLSNEIFMAGVHDEVKSALARPVDNIPLFLIATADLPATDQIDLLTLNCAARLDPTRIMYLLGQDDEREDTGSVSHKKNRDIVSIITSLGDVASESVDTALDQLQRRLLSRRSLVSRLLTLTLALLATLGAGWASTGALSLNVYAVGFVSGLLAVALRDMSSGAMKRLSR